MGKKRNKKKKSNSLRLMCQVGTPVMSSFIWVTPDDVAKFKKAGFDFVNGIDYDKKT
jgi:hypothetical protein